MSKIIIHKFKPTKISEALCNQWGYVELVTGRSKVTCKKCLWYMEKQNAKSD